MKKFFKNFKKIVTTLLIASVILGTLPSEPGENSADPLGGGFPIDFIEQN